jgi:hypothetical protein
MSNISELTSFDYPEIADNSPTGVAFNTDNNYTYVSTFEFNLLYRANTLTPLANPVLVYDFEPDHPSAGAPGLHSLAYGSGTNLLYISAFRTNQILICDTTVAIPANPQLGILSTGGNPTGVMVDGNFLYVSVNSNGTVVRYTLDALIAVDRTNAVALAAAIVAVQGTQTTIVTSLNQPQGLLKLGNNYYVCEDNSVNIGLGKVSKFDNNWANKVTFCSIPGPKGIASYNGYITVGSNFNNIGSGVKLYSDDGTLAMSPNFTDTPSPYGLAFTSAPSPYNNLFYVGSFSVGLYVYEFDYVFCFHENTKILCLIDEKEEYVPIKNLTKEHDVKTYLHGYRKIKSIGKRSFINNPNNMTNCMYVLKKTEDNNLTEDLMLTGGHSILVDEITKNERKKQSLYWRQEQVIDNKKLLLAGVSSLFEPVMTNEIFTYYHFTLEHNENESSHKRFGVYANEVLVETPTNKTFNSYKLNLQ